MEKTGAKRVAISGANDKQQITAIFARSMNGKFLPPQLIYQGKTPKCLPPLDDVPSDWDINFTGADPESGKRGGTLLKKVEEQKKKKKKVTTIIASYPLPNILYHVCYVK